MLACENGKPCNIGSCFHSLTSKANNTGHSEIKNKYNYTIVYLDCTVLYNLRNRPTFHAEERLVNLARGRECFVDLSTYVILYCILSLCQVTGALQTSAEVMKSMQSLIKLPEIQRTMQELSRWAFLSNIFLYEHCISYRVSCKIFTSAP